MNTIQIWFNWKIEELFFMHSLLGGDLMKRHRYSYDLRGTFSANGKVPLHTHTEKNILNLDKLNQNSDSNQIWYPIPKCLILITVSPNDLETICKKKAFTWKTGRPSSFDDIMHIIYLNTFSYHSEEFYLFNETPLNIYSGVLHAYVANKNTHWLSFFCL